MRTGRPTPRLQLSQEERATLERWVRRPTTAQALAQRARIVLRAAADKAGDADRGQMAQSLHHEARRRIAG